MLFMRASCSAVNASSGLILGYSAATSRVKSCKFLWGYFNINSNSNSNSNSTFLLKFLRRLGGVFIIILSKLTL